MGYDIQRMKILFSWQRIPRHKIIQAMKKGLCVALKHVISEAFVSPYGELVLNKLSPKGEQAYNTTVSLYFFSFGAKL